MFGTVFINCHIIHSVIFTLLGSQSKCESYTLKTVVCIAHQIAVTP